MNDTKEDEDLEDLMAAVARALSQAERDAQTTQPDRADAQDAEGNAGMQNGQKETTGIRRDDFLQGGPKQTMRGDLSD
jgi:hypothetical protein